MLLMNVVGTPVPESWITVVGVNPVPVTTIVTADEPTGTSLGVTYLIASGEAVPPTPEADPEFVGAPPHPERKVRNRQEEETRRKKLTGPAEHNFIESADSRNPRGRARKNVLRNTGNRIAETIYSMRNWRR